MMGLKSLLGENRITLPFIVFFPFLFILSFVYGVLVFLARLLYRKGIVASYRPRAKVISVGNITVGGSGKTPLVEYVASFLAQDHRRAAILLRGYKRPGSGAESCGSFTVYGDEGAMLKRNLGERVLVEAGYDRAALAKRLDQDNRCDTIILDDGFQHWRIQRDLDIVTLDASRPFGNRFLLPAGHLREGLSSLKHAQIFCLTRCDEVSSGAISSLESVLRKINPQALVVRTRHRPESVEHLKTGAVDQLAGLRGLRAGLFCGIANSSSFLKTVQKLGAQICWQKFFGDHHVYTRREMANLAQECLKQNISCLVTTQKDAVRLEGVYSRQKAQIDILVLKISLEVLTGKEALDGRLHSLYYR